MPAGCTAAEPAAAELPAGTCTHPVSDILHTMRVTVAAERLLPVTGDTGRIFMSKDAWEMAGPLHLEREDRTTGDPDGVMHLGRPQCASSTSAVRWAPRELRSRPDLRP